MKKLLTAALLATATMAMHAEFTSFTFRTTDGKEQTVSADGLSISFADGKLTATNVNGSLSIPLSNMQSMAFTDYVSGIASAETGTYEGGTYYNTHGMCCGTYASQADAAATLPAGIYIVRTDEGKTIKTSIR